MGRQHLVSLVSDVADAALDNSPSHFRSERLLVLRGAFLLFAGFLGAYSAPYQLAALSASGAVGSAAAPWLVTTNILATAFGSLLASALLGRWPIRRFATAGLLLFVAGQAADLAGQTVILHAAGRSMAGLGAGFVLASANAVLLSSVRPEASYGRASALMSVMFALFFGLAPHIASLSEAGFLFLASAVAGLLCLPFCAGLTTAKLETGSDVAPADRNWLAAGLLVAAVTAYYLACGTGYSMSERSAQQVGVAPETYGLLLATFSLFGILGAAAAGWLGDRTGRLLPLSAGTVVTGLSLYLITNPVSTGGFGAGLLGYGLAYPFTATYFMGLAASLDKSSRLVVAIGGYILIPYSFGPAFGGSSLQSVGWGGLSLLIAALALVATTAALGSAASARRLFPQHR